jgi:hypothetical protein
MTTLPTPQVLLTKILSSLPASTPSMSANPLRNAPQSTKHILQTLHVLYPNEFLPALDLLDRHLITRLFIKPSAPEFAGNQNQDGEHEAPSSPPEEPGIKETCIYYVRSAQPQKQSYPSAAGTFGRTYDALSTHYEVRPLAWNCSCPAFAFAAFPAVIDTHGDDDVRSDIWDERDDGHGKDKWLFGGLSRERAAPVCKHLLACVLVERCEIFAACVEVRGVSIEELAGLCAGWGG